MYQSSLSICLVTNPTPIVLGTILPNLKALSIFHAHQYFTGVDSAITKSYWSKVLSKLGVLHFRSDPCVSLVIVVTAHLRHHLFALVNCLSVHRYLVLLSLRSILIVIVNSHISLLRLLEFLSI